MFPKVRELHTRVAHGLTIRQRETPPPEAQVPGEDEEGTAGAVPSQAIRDCPAPSSSLQAQASEAEYEPGGNPGILRLGCAGEVREHPVRLDDAPGDAVLQLRVKPAADGRREGVRAARETRDSDARVAE